MWFCWRKTEICFLTFVKLDNKYHKNNKSLISLMLLLSKKIIYLYQKVFPKQTGLFKKVKISSLNHLSKNNMPISFCFQLVGFFEASYERNANNFVRNYEKYSWRLMGIKVKQRWNKGICWRRCRGPRRWGGHNTGYITGTSQAQGTSQVGTIQGGTMTLNNIIPTTTCDIYEHSC